MSWKCSHCMKKEVRVNNGIRIIYCTCNKFFPNPNYIKFYGCDYYEDEQLKLFNEEKNL